MTIEEATEAFLRDLEHRGSPLVFDARTFWEGYQAGALTVAILITGSMAKSAQHCESKLDEKQPN